MDLQLLSESSEHQLENVYNNYARYFYWLDSLVFMNYFGFKDGG